MKSTRRNFFKVAGVATAGLFTGINSVQASLISPSGRPIKGNGRKQTFNMSGYSAPKLDTVRIGIVGLGMRGPGAVERMANIEGVEIRGLSDKYSDRVDRAQRILLDAGLPKAKAYGGSEDAWKKMCSADDIDLIYICTPWSMHTPMAVYAMEHGKHVASEVPAAVTIEEAWLLVETSEKTRKHCMMLENCCYDFFELMTLNMAQQGFFGDLVHAEGAYIHDLRELNFDKNSYTDMWRLKENQRRNGNLYPTHGLGPVCQAMNINRGDRMDYLTSMSSNDFQMAKMADRLAGEDSFYKPFATDNYRGNMNTTVVRTEKGRTIMIQHDVTSPRPYSRIHLLSGTKGLARKWPNPERIARGHEWVDDAEMRDLQKEYAPEIVKRVGEMAKEVGGHGGMDFLMDWRLIDCLRNGLPLDQDVYDAALWSSISPLSEWSVANRSNSIDIPDFTAGAYKTNLPVDLGMEKGGDTGIRKGKTKSQLELK